MRGEPTYTETETESAEDFIIVRGLQPNQIYEFKAVAVDGEYMTESAAQDVDTYNIGNFI